MSRRWSTAGEQFLERTLKKEYREGVQHYVLGQHQADMVEDARAKACLLSYVSYQGVVFVPLIHKDDHWQHLGYARILGLSVDYGMKELPEDWELTEKMMAAISAAETRAKGESDVDSV